MTAVFFLFLLHLSVGLLVALALVPDRAGARFFKLCAASATLMTLAGTWLLYRRYGQSGAGALFPRYTLVVGAAAAMLVFTTVFNRAWHFAWTKATRPFLLLALACGLVAMAASSRNGLELASDATSALLLGAATSAMILGHYYLVVLDLPISALRRLTWLLAVSLGLRTAVVLFALLGPAQAGLEEARLVASGRFHADGVFIWMRLLFGIAGPLSLVGFVWKTVEIRSTQSATGILYVQMFLVLAGELLAKHLRVMGGLPL